MLARDASLGSVSPIRGGLRLDVITLMEPINDPAGRGLVASDSSLARSANQGVPIWDCSAGQSVPPMLPSHAPLPSPPPPSLPFPPSPPPPPHAGEAMPERCPGNGDTDRAAHVAHAAFVGALQVEASGVSDRLASGAV